MSAAAWQGGVIAFGVNVLGMIQSVARYLFLPLAAWDLCRGCDGIGG